MTNFLSQLLKSGTAGRSDTAKATFAFSHDAHPTALHGWAVATDGTLDDSTIVVSLLAGQFVLGHLRRDRPRSDVAKEVRNAPEMPGFSVSDFGLGAFARAAGISSLSVEVAAPGAPTHRFGLDLDVMATYNPLGSLAGLRTGTTVLVDAWMASGRDLMLRFGVGERGALPNISAFQHIAGKKGELVKIEAEASGTGFIVHLRLRSGMMPVLLVLAAPDGMIDGIEYIPFPALLRGGAHAVERQAVGHGGNELSAAGALSRDLLADMHGSASDSSRIRTVALSGPFEQNFQPLFEPDLLNWLTLEQGITVELDADPNEVPDEFVAALPAGVVPSRSERPPGSGHRLIVPSGAIPTLSAIIRPLAARGRNNRIDGSYLAVGAMPNGSVWSVWHPSGVESCGLSLPSSQGGATLGPVLELQSARERSDEIEDVSPGWPLAICERGRPTQVPLAARPERLSDLANDLAKPKADWPVVDVIAFVEEGSDALPMFSSLQCQDGVEIGQIIVTYSSKRGIRSLRTALEQAFRRLRFVPVPADASRIDALAIAIEAVTAQRALVIDSGVILADGLTLALLDRMLDERDVASASCAVEGPRGHFAAGFCISGANFRGRPTLAFEALDAGAFVKPVAIPVVANSSRVMLLGEYALEVLRKRTPQFGRHATDDVMFGVDLIAGGKVNKCSTLVVARGDLGHATSANVTPSVPYRFSVQGLARMIENSAFVQRIK